MAQQYASKLPQGFKNHVENIAVVGAGGQVGKFIVDALLKNGKHKVTAITRANSTNTIPAGAEVKTVDYEHHSSLVEALRGQDVLIISMAVTAPPDTQQKLFLAAADAGVPWVMPNEYGSNAANDSLVQDTFIGNGYRTNRAAIEKLGKSSWVALSSSFWYEFSLSRGSLGFGIDIPSRTAIFFDDGNTKISTSTWPQCGLAVAKLFSLKVLPEDENDKSPCLSDYKNQPCFVESFVVSQKDMFDSVLRVTGTTPDDWTIKYVPSKERYQSGLQMFQAGQRTGFAKILYTRVMFPDGSGNFHTTTPPVKISNDILGLPKEDLDEATKVAVKMADEWDEVTKETGRELLKTE